MTYRGFLKRCRQRPSGTGDAGGRDLRRSGGGSGIRTHDTVSRIHAFQASAFSHSAISPDQRRNIAAVRCLTTSTGELISRPAVVKTLHEATQEDVMGRGLLLWLLGIPLPIILLIW